MRQGVQQHGANRSLSVLIPSRLTRQAALAALLFLPATPLPALAAAPTPAGDAQMTLYARAAALNVCIARAAGVDFDKAAAIAGETIAQLIQAEHGGVIAVVGRKALSAEELVQGSINSAVIGAVEICPQQVPAEVLRTVQAALRQADGTRGRSPAAPRR
jgi:hypothetical protein